MEGSTSRVYFEPWCNAVRRLVGDAQLVIIADPTVRSIYAAALADFDVVEVPLGEGGKTLAVAERLYHELYHREVERSAWIVALGGGVVCDLAGFVAATFLRGLRFGSVPTTLLAQVDAAHGGKNGVNFGDRKNLVGTIRQPEFIVCDTRLLKSLPEAQMRDGLAEVIKHGIIADPAILDLLPMTGLPTESVVAELIQRSIVVKTAVVGRDLHEAGERRNLNFGHTIGHGFEVVCKISHGQAVALGMVYELALSVARGALDPVLRDRCVHIIDGTGLPTRLTFDRAQVLAALRHDKKRIGERIAIPIIHGLGRAEVEEVPFAEIEQVLAV